MCSKVCSNLSVTLSNLPRILGINIIQSGDVAKGGRKTHLASQGSAPVFRAKSQPSEQKQDTNVPSDVMYSSYSNRKLSLQYQAGKSPVLATPDTVRVTGD